MGFTNYHSHSEFCDGTGHPEEYIKKAIEIGMTAYGFSSHAPVPFECNWTMKKEELPNYIKTIDELKEKYKNKIQIYKGLETDYIPGKCGPASKHVQDSKLDYIIGGVHFIDAFDDDTAWDIDGAHTVFEKGLKEIFHNDIKAVVRRYFQIIRQMITDEKPDVLAHFDKIKTQNPDDRYYNRDEDWYQEEIQKTLDIVKQNGTIVEVNTKGVYSGAYPELFPNEQVLKIVKEKDIPVTMSADAHTPADISSGFDIAAASLKKVGFEKIVALIDNQWRAFEFNEKGIVY